MYADTEVVLRVKPSLLSGFKRQFEHFDKLYWSTRHRILCSDVHWSWRYKRTAV